MAENPGPLVRFEHLTTKPDTMDIIVQRVADGDTLRGIAKSWEVPFGKLAGWVVDDRERADAYSRALEMWAESEAHAAVGIADAVDANRDAVAKANLQVKTRLAIAGKLARPRYGESTEVKHTGAVSLIAVLSGLPRDERLVQSVPAAALAVPSEVAAEPI